MKKGFTKFLITTIFTLSILFCSQLKSAYANNKTFTSDYASYTEQEIIETNNLGYNIIHNKIKALSTANSCSNPKDGYLLTNSPQQVNMLSVPSTGNVRIVNYTYPNSSGWTKQTLSKLVQSFELTNPGWTVLAGVNGDFYDINGKDYALKYHTTGTTVSNNDVLRAVETKSIGYTNNGTANSFKIVDKATFTSYHILTIYDDLGNIIKTFNVDKINEEPSDNELSVYYTYKVNNDTAADLVSVTVPANNSYISEYPTRCLPTSEPEIFAKGEISKTNIEMKLRFGQFAIVTNNQEIKSYLQIGTNIRVQKDVTGELADCDQIMGSGSTLIENGVVSQDNSDGMRLQRHPRTCIGAKEDGTLMFFVIDGRQESAGYNGMTQDEMGAMMAYYGCYNGVNVDGGGSSTFGIRDEYGNFVIQNKPSDGNERTNSNALLVVVPQVQIQKSNIKDDSIMLSYNKPLRGIEVNNILVTINGITKEMNSTEFVFDGLEPETEYELNYTYDLTYNGSTSNIQGATYKFTTGKIGPKVEYAYYDVNVNMVNLSYKASDINNLATFGCIDYSDDIEFIDDFGESNLNIRLSNVNKFDFKIEIDYATQSIPNNNSKIIYYFTWFPLSIDLSNVSPDDMNKINEIINDTNNIISTIEDKNEVIEKINSSKEEINEIISYEKTVLEAIQKLDDYITQNIEKYSNDNQVLIQQYVEEAKKQIENEKELENIEVIINNALEQISNIKTIEQEKAEELEEHKTQKAKELEDFVTQNIEKYSNDNQVLIQQYVEEAKKQIENEKELKNIEVILNNALEQISNIKTIEQEKAEELSIFKIQKISELEEYINGKKYSKKNQNKAIEIIEESINKINSSKDLEEVKLNFYNAIFKLGELKTKNCKSNTLVIYANILMLISFAYVLIKKSK